MTTDHIAQRRQVKVTVDKRGTRYVVPKGEEYLTTVEIAKALNLYSETVWRWCIKWFGKLPKDGPNRQGVGGGYRIPPPYLLVAKAWSLVEDEVTREAAKVALLESPKDWVIVVDKDGSTHYSVGEVEARITAILGSDTKPSRITILYVGGLHQD